MESAENVNPDSGERQVDPIGVQVVERTMERFFERADVRLVYGRPIRQGDSTLIPTAEVTVAGGFGAGHGFGFGMDEETDNPGSSGGAGSGGGGGGTTSARPVAVIVASPEGVRVEPVVDFTKIGLALITAWGFMLSMIVRIRRGG